MEYASFDGSALPLKHPDSTQVLYHLSSTSAGLYAFEISLIKAVIIRILQGCVKFLLYVCFPQAAKSPTAGAIGVFVRRCWFFFIMRLTNSSGEIDSSKNWYDI